MGKDITELQVDGMDCNNCAMSITRFLERKGLEEVYVNFQTKEVRFRRDEEKLSTEKVIAGINKLGFTVLEGDNEASWWNLEKKLWVSAVFTAPLIVGHLLMMVGIHTPLMENGWVQLIFCLPPYLIGIWYFGSSAWSSIRGGVPNMDVLIFVGSTAAFIYSVAGLMLQDANYFFFETTATIITLVLAGNWLEHRAVEQTTSAIGELTKLQAESAQQIMPSGTVITISKEEVKAGMILQVNEGDKIPADGQVLTGMGQVDESMLTGESMPVDKEEGDELIGSSILVGGNLQMKVTAAGKDSVLHQMIELVKTAQQDKPPIQRLADQISAIFVPVVLGIAALTFVIGHWGFGLLFQQALMNAIAVLVISCPCAMGLATPTAVMVGVGRLAKNGVLIKGGRTVEQLARLKRIIFDKTGTLTTGDFRIKDIKYPAGEEELSNTIIHQIEQYSSHPIAASLQSEMIGRPMLMGVALQDIREEKGIGMFASDRQGNCFRLGSQRILKQEGFDTDADLYLTRNDEVMAQIYLGDQTKDGVETTLTYLKKEGIEPVILSGDRQQKTQLIAEQLTVDTFYAEQLPDQKLAIVEQLSREELTAMVGDGINDAPALAKADLGISLSNASQVAIQSAQVVLLNGRIDVLPKALQISKHTVRTIRQNLFWAFIYNIVAIPIAAAGLLNPMLGALFMAFSDVVVIGNSIRLKYKSVD